MRPRPPTGPATADLPRATLRHLREHRPELCEHGIVAIGFSLGTCALGHYLAEEGDDCGVLAAALVSPPIDLTMTSKQLSGWRTLPYRRWLLPKVKYEILRPTVRAELPDDWLMSATAATTVWDFDAALNAPRFQLDGARAFYEKFGLLDTLGGVRVPTLAVASRDDIFVPFAMHSAYDWDANPNLHPVHTKRGGHCGFHARDLELPWCDRLALKFFERHAGA